MSQILVPVAFGELIDKITILEIKSERMTDPAKLANVRHELSELRATWAASWRRGSPAPPARSRVVACSRGTRSRRCSSPYS